MVSEKPWRPEAVLLLGAGLLATLSVSMIGLFFAQKKEGAPNFVQFVGSTVVVQFIALCLIHFFLRYHGIKWSDFLGLRRRRVFLAVLFGIAVAIIATPLGWGANQLSAKLITLLHRAPEEQAVIKVLEASSDPAERTIFALVAIIMAPLIEEALFRGILYPLLKYRGYPRLAVWGTSLLFAAIHGNLMTFLPLFIFALVLIWIYERTDTLAAPIAAHALFNAINFVVFLNQQPIDRWLQTLRERV